MEKKVQIQEKFKEHMNAFMMIKVMGQTGVNFINRGKLKKEILGYLDVFSKDDGLKEFALYYVDSCLNSKAYRTAVFGTIPMSDAGAATRIAQDIDEVTRIIPEKIGVVQDFLPVRALFLDAFREKIEDGDRILREAGIL